VSSQPWPKGLAGLVKLSRAGDRALQLLLFNEECLVSASHQLADYVPALYTRIPSLLPIEWLSEVSGLALGSWQPLPIAGKLIKLGQLEEVKVVTKCPWVNHGRIIND
jgi:hypothetical protein